MHSLKVLFAPAEFEALDVRDLNGATCVVFDVLRATSTMIEALRNGAIGIVPVASIDEALQWRKSDPAVLLAGERDGVRITAAQTGGIDFDFGNSPREFVAAKVSGKVIISTTTNGTRALRACAGAARVFAASFANLSATAEQLRELRPGSLLLVCSGTGNEASFEDTLCAGALADLIWNEDYLRDWADSAAMARAIYQANRNDLQRAMQHAANGRRLLATGDLAEDVAFCLRRDTASFAAALNADGVVRRV